jgi:multiple sugar transport system substrate-binding protein
MDYKGYRILRDLESSFPMSAVVSFVSIFLWLTIMVLPVAGAQGKISFWTTEVEKDRMEIQQEIAGLFLRETGIAVNLVPVQENLLAQRVTAAYAARSLPDVIYHPIDFTLGWAEAGILDCQSATGVVNRLGKATFGKGPLKLARSSTGYAAVPMDGWGQLLLYRKDLFQEKGLPVPKCWSTILMAAEALHNPPSIWGFEVATDPSETYTQQVFEHFALSNKAGLTGPSGNINMDSAEMVETIEFYKALSHFTPPGNISWLHTRMDYLSGRAAMIIWSPFILDELSGLRQDQPVVPDIVKRTPGFLATNTGFVAMIEGPKGTAQYGQINCLGITIDADRTAAMRWVEFLLTDGYLKWLSMAAEGKLPVRKGTPNALTRFIDGWMELKFGVTTRARISQFYGPDVLKTIMAGLDGLGRWGFTEGKGALMSKIYGTKIIPEILKRYLDGEMSAKQAAHTMNKRVRALE